MNLTKKYKGGSSFLKRLFGIGSKKILYKRNPI